MAFKRNATSMILLRICLMCYSNFRQIPTWKYHMIKIMSPILNSVFLIYQEGWKLDIRSKHFNLDVNIFEVTMSLFPFLEKEKSLYISMIDTNNIKAIESFPAKEIIEAGFIQNTSYTVKLAVAWLDNEDNNDLNVYFSTYLKKILNNKVYEQRTRQIAEKLFNYTLKN